MSYAAKVRRWVCHLPLLALVFGVTQVQAWDEHEHASIGATGYQLACKAQRPRADEQQPAWRTQFTGALRAEAEARLELVCPIDRWLLAQRAAAYGQMVAISGDHLESPEAFQDGLQGRQVSSIVDYGVLALSNHLHFEPMSLREWRRVRANALVQALAASRASGVERLRTLDRALATQAFADHFLQDSFAAGHMGNNRAASGPGAAWVLHNYWNGTGRLVRDGFSSSPQPLLQRSSVARSNLPQSPNAETPTAAHPAVPAKPGEVQWVTFGDGRLDRCKNNYGITTCWDRLVSSQQASVTDFILAFVVGKREGAAEELTDASIPQYALSPRVVRTWYGTFHSFPHEFEDKEQPDTDRQWYAWTPVTHTSRPAYRSRELFLAYGYEQLEKAPHSLVAELADGLLPNAVWWRAALGISMDMASTGSAVQGGTIRLKPFLAHTTLLSFAQNVFNHELSVAELNVPFRPRRSANTFDWILKPVAYRLNVELGKFVFHGDAGLALGDVPGKHRRDAFRAGFFVAGGISYTLTASGGGNWHGQGR